MLCYDEYVRLNLMIAKAIKEKVMIKFKTLTSTLKKIIFYNKQESIQYYEECLRLDPDDIDAYSGKADALIKMNKNDEAVQCYEEIFQFETEEEISVQNINDLIELQQYDASIKYFDCDAYKGRGIHHLIRVADALIESKQFEEAIKQHEECIQRNSNYFDAYQVLLIVQRKKQLFNSQQIITNEFYQQHFINFRCKQQIKPSLIDKYFFHKNYKKVKRDNIIRELKVNDEIFF